MRKKATQKKTKQSYYYCWDPTQSGDKVTSVSEKIAAKDGAEAATKYYNQYKGFIPLRKVRVAKVTIVGEFEVQRSTTTSLTKVE